MVEDILDKIVVPNVKSTKGDVFKKDKAEEGRVKEGYKEFKKKEEDERPQEKTEYVLHEKKEVFKRGEFDTRKPVSFNIKAPGLMERGIYILIILVLIYFAFFKNINLNLDFGKVFGDNIQPLAVKSVENKTEVKDVKKEEPIKVETPQTELSGKITLTIDKVNTEKYETGISKITGFTFTVDNQKEVFDGKIIYYAYDSSTPIMWKTKARGESTYLMPVGITTNTVNTKVIFSSSSTKTMRFEVTDKNTNEVIANITKEVIIS